MLRLAADAIFSFSSTPIKAIVWCSMVLWGLSLLFLGWSCYAHFMLNATTAGWTSIVFLLNFFTGLILMSIAVVGSYVGRIFEQGQQRPLYWLEQARNVRFAADQQAMSPEARLSRRVIEANEAIADKSSGESIRPRSYSEAAAHAGLHS